MREKDNIITPKCTQQLISLQKHLIITTIITVTSLKIGYSITLTSALIHFKTANRGENIIIKDLRRYSGTFQNTPRACESKQRWYYESWEAKAILIWPELVAMSALTLRWVSPTCPLIEPQPLSFLYRQTLRTPHILIIPLPPPILLLFSISEVLHWSWALLLLSSLFLLNWTLTLELLYI